MAKTDYPMIFDEMHRLFPRPSKEERRRLSYQRFVGIPAWRMYQRFDDRFDVRVGGHYLEAKQSIDPATGDVNSTLKGEYSLEEFAAIPKTPKPPAIIDWTGDGRELSAEEAEREGLHDVVAFLRKKIEEYKAWQESQNS